MFKSFIKRFLTSTLLAVTIIGGAILAPEAHNHYLRYEVGSSVVQVLSPLGGGGTGFAVKGASGKDYIMTNKHVCDAAVNNAVLIKKDKDTEALYREVVYKDDRHDLCLIQGVDNLDPLSIGAAPGKGDFHYIIGHPGLRQLTVSQGEYIGFAIVRLIDDVEKKSQCVGQIYELNPIQQLFMGREWLCIRSYKSASTTAVTYPGNSGSPVVNKFGNLIGVLFAGSTAEERDNYFVPLYEVKRVLNQF